MFHWNQRPKLVRAHHLEPPRARDGPSPEDRRATVRISLTLPARLSAQGTNTWLEVETCDLSPGGAGLVSACAWQTHAPVTFACSVPGRSGPVEIEVVARIAWCEPIPDGTVLARAGFRCGVEFEPMCRRDEDGLVGALLHLETRTPR